jgi:predicted O-methyltransferase YrrM
VKICFFPGDYSGAGCYRCLFPGRELKDQFGHETFVPEAVYAGGGTYTYQLKTVPNADLYVLQQRPEKEWLKMIPFLKDRGKIIVCETDDYYHGVPFWHPAYEITRPLLEPMKKIYAMADAMTVSTPFLKEIYSQYNSNIHVLPNYWDATMWVDLPKKDWKRLRIGWMGVAKMRPADMQVLQGVIGPFLKRHPEVDFVAAGDPLVHDILDVPGDQRVSYPRVEFGRTPEITATMDIGLVPLCEAPFNEAKSYLKGLEYAICGIPCIASPTGPYRFWVEEGVNGFLARRPRDWLRHLERLVGDQGLREQMGRAARQKAERFTIQEHAHKWNHLYESLIGDEYDQIARDAIGKLALQKPGECAAFLRYIGDRKPKVVVEIGTAQGGMLYALAQLAADDAHIISIDFPGGDLGGTIPDVYGERDTEKMRSYIRASQRVEFLQMDSQHRATRATLDRILGGRPIDLLFIDGDHAYQGVKNDFELYSPLVAPDGLIAFHDIMSHKAIDVEVDRLWNEIKHDYAYREFIGTEDWGWGVWGGIGVLEMQRERIAA